MAELIDFGGDASSNLVAGLGTNQAVFTMPSNVGIKVQSVVATINNGTASDVTATVVVRDQSGQVIATRRQADVIPSGDVGTATWALRLGDNGGGGGDIRFNRVNTGSWLTITTTRAGPGDALSITTTNSAGMNIQSDGVLSEFADGSYSIGGNADLLMQFSGDVNIQPSNDFLAQPLGNALVDALGSLTLRGDTVDITLRGTSDLTVYDSSGNPIFRVDQDGDLHGKTGKSLTFDL